jgi:hypothetical protein
MFGSSEDRARQLAGRYRRERHGSSGTQGSQRTVSSSSQSPVSQDQSGYTTQSPVQNLNHRRVRRLPGHSQLFTPPEGQLRLNSAGQQPMMWKDARPRPTLAFSIPEYEQITAQNSPDYVIFYNSLVDQERFVAEFSSKLLRTPFTRTEKRVWFASIPPDSQAAFKKIVLGRLNAIRGPNKMQLRSTGLSTPISSPSVSIPVLTLIDALDAIEGHYSNRSHTHPLMRSISTPVMGMAGNGLREKRSFSTYCISCVHCPAISPSFSFL